MYPNDNIIWQPTHLYQPHHDFEILLSRQFAGEMLEVILTTEMQCRMNELGAGIIKRFRYSGNSPYMFHENTAFVRQITLNGSKGTWLELEGQSGKLLDLSKTEPLKYTTKNMDSSFDSLGLFCLFDQWVSYSETLKNIPE